MRDECHDLVRERVILKRRADHWGALRQDLRLTMRGFSANRVFAALVVFTIAIGIGANAAVFSVTYGTLLRPLPFHDAGALVRLWSRNAPRHLDFFSVSAPDYRDWKAQARELSAMAAFERQHDATVMHAGEVEAVQASAVSPDIFPLLGTTPFRGRALVADDAAPGAPAVAVVRYGFWNSRFGADPSLVGSALDLDGTRVTVVGIMPPRFAIPGTPADIWTPITSASTDRGNRYLRVLARLRPGATLQSAASEMDTIAQRLAREYADTNGPWRVNIMSVPEIIVGTKYRRAMLALLGVVAMVLLIACANAANLQLARGATRRREIAIRTALGAARTRIVWQLLMESVVLSIVAGALGLVLAYGGVSLLRTFGETTVPRLADVRLDAPVVGFALAVTLGSALLFGLVPALRTSRASPGDVLRESGRGQGAVAAAQRLRSALVVAEVSLTLMLLVGAGLLLRSFAHLRDVDIGFRPAGVAAAPMRLPDATYPTPGRVAQFYAAFLQRATRLPGVTSAALVSSPPFMGPNASNVYLPVGAPADVRTNAPDADYRAITPGYLRVIGIPLRAGRDFADTDGPGAPEVMLVSETFARRTWPGTNPLGRTIRVGDIIKGPVFTVVGVVGDARYYDLLQPETRPMMYFSSLARPQRAMTLVARGDAGRIAGELRAAVGGLDSRLPALTATPLSDAVDQATATTRFAVVLFGLFAGIALILAVVGIYGVLSYLVRQRTHELGIRIALGAPGSVVVGSVVGEAMRLTLAGVASGMAGAWALSRTLSALLFGVTVHDGATFAAVAGLLTAASLLGSLLPARRATRADPLRALRAD